MPRVLEALSRPPRTCNTALQCCTYIYPTQKLHWVVDCRPQGRWLPQSSGYSEGFDALRQPIPCCREHGNLWNAGQHSPSNCLLQLGTEIAIRLPPTCRRNLVENGSGAFRSCLAELKTRNAGRVPLTLTRRSKKMPGCGPRSTSEGNAADLKAYVKASLPLQRQPE